MSVNGPSIPAISEIARERETFRYYPALITDAIPNCPRNLVPSSQLKTSCDSALTAFCQVAALRLGCARSLISLFDRDSQFVVAEATATSSLAPSSTASTDNDRLWLSGTSFPRSFGVCEHVLVSAACAATIQGNPPPSVTVIDDLAADESFSDRPYCYAWPDNRFYAGVPLQTPRGLTIGVLCVFDHKPRAGLEDAHKTVLQELAATVMSYLEARRVTDKYRQADRVTRGIRAFFHGSTPNKRRGEGQGIGPRSRPDSDASRTAPDMDSELDLDSNGDGSIDLRRAVAKASLPIRQSVIDTNSHSVAVVVDSPQDPSASMPAASATGDLFTPYEDGQDKTQRTLTRGCNIFRSALELDGLLLLDGSVSLSASPTTVSTAHHSRNPTDGAFISTNEAEDIAGDANVGGHGDDSAICTVLGSSASSAAKQDRDSYFGNAILREKTLERLLRYFPHGTIWNFDEGGKMDSSDASSDDADCEKPRRHSVVRELGDEILQLLPNARSVAFFPIWDTQKQRWFAGGFAHTEKPTRVLSIKAELSYLRVFGTVVMAEVSALRDQDVERSKLGVLNSMSHELRSPLHGIIVGVEMMQESQLDASQEDTLRSVEVCGRTLLDTIDQILDWTRINRFAPSPEARISEDVVSRHGHVPQPRRATNAEIGLMSLTSKVDLVTLVEDVIESVHAGHVFQSLSYNGDNSTLWHPFGSSQPGNDNIKVIINALPSASWDFRLQVGNIRRVIMNIVGNSLKFTTRGVVYVQVEQVEDENASETGSRLVRFTIADTGCGISSDYLAHGIFVPFSQEDSMEPGTGLGLSVVKRIVQSLRGTVDIHSTPNVGTTVRVTVPLEPCSEDNCRPSLLATVRRSQDKALASQLADLKGLRVCLVGFDGENSKELVNPLLPSTMSEMGNMEAMCRDWLGLTVVGSSPDHGVLPDVIVCHESSVNSSSLHVWGDKSIPLLFVCPSTMAARRLAEKRTTNHELAHYTHQPLGPRKFARALTRLLRDWMAKQPLQEEPGEALAITARARLLEPNYSAPTPAIEEPLEMPIIQTTGDTVAQPTLVQDPLLTPKPTPVEKPNPLEDPPQPESGLYLLVDDNPINLKMLIAFMKKLGQPYKTATNGAEAVAQYRQHPSLYKCILMDISMPVMNGFEATRAIRAIEAELNLPRCMTLALTGLASRESQNEAFLCGIDLFLTKPIKFAELRRIFHERNLI